MSSVIERLSTFFFIVAGLIAILSGAFEQTAVYNVFAVSILVFLGVVTGLLSITDDEKTHFLLGGIGYIVATVFLESIFDDIVLYNSIGVMLEYFAIFISASVLVVGFSIITKTGSSVTEKIRAHHEKVTIWDTVVTGAVCVSLVTFILLLFYDVGEFLLWIAMIDYIVTIVFIVDLVYLYRKSHGFIDFVKTSYLDIIAAIPFSLFLPIKVASIFNLTKFSRLSKLLRLLRILRISQGGKFVKYFSKKSGFNKFF